MNEEEIKVLSSGDKSGVLQILEKFLKDNENVFTFPNLSMNNNRVSLWAALFQLIQEPSLESVHAMCLSALRILSRDKLEVDAIVCEKWIIILIDKAGLFNFLNIDDETRPVEIIPQKEEAIEALKCLCNLALNSEVSRALCAHTAIAQGLVARLRSYKDIPYKDDIMLFDMKLLFILTALRQDISAKIKSELHGMDYLISCLNEIITEASVDPDVAGACGGVTGDSHCFLQDNQEAIICEILKIQFNLTLQNSLDDQVDEEEEAIYLRLMPVLTTLLSAHVSSEQKLHELRNNIVNVLVSVPSKFYPYLTPDFNEGEKPQYVYDTKNMESIQSLIQFLLHRLTITTNTSNQNEYLCPILTVLNKSARSCRAHRKYLRQEVLPPLRDVSRPPEKGSTLRNQLCRLLTTPITAIRDLVAEFLFILCKEKVGRMVKYTGFGNAAGHLAQKGLLSGGRGPVVYSSSSEDSDTEEYLEAQPHIDPVVGCTRPPRVNPFEGMTEEQKEYEAMKLVNLFDKMVSTGVVKPARVGPDGRPQPLDHVLEMREHPPNRPQS
ncbi:PREDICTED: synembryn-A [Papilio xuthus]|uniref:Synembryn-A n=1 Tax=Papilio xuthus TaxID=66420 RepID=A0AAJ6ZM27_PAPXU|nr:PREDICTED: synembryn-A [Papilio xuthus]